MDDQTNETPEQTDESDDFSFAREVAKSFALSTVITAGTVAGFVAAGYAYSKFDDWRTARRDRKANAVSTTPEQN